MIKENQKTLAELRVRHGWKQTEVAKMIGMNAASYNAIEQVNDELLAKIADIYGVAPETIYIAG